MTKNNTNTETINNATTNTNIKEETKMTRKEKDYAAATDAYVRIVEIKDRVQDVLITEEMKPELLQDIINVINSVGRRGLTIAQVKRLAKFTMTELPTEYPDGTVADKSLHIITIAQDVLTKIGLPVDANTIDAEPKAEEVAQAENTEAPETAQETANKNFIFCSNYFTETLGDARNEFFEASAMNIDTKNSCMRKMFGTIMKAIAFADKNGGTIVVDTTNTDFACIMYSLIASYKKQVNKDITVGYMGVEKMNPNKYGGTIVCQGQDKRLYIVRANYKGNIRAIYELCHDQTAIKPLNINYVGGTFWDDSFLRWIPIATLGLSRVPVKEFIKNDKVSAYVKSNLIPVLSNETISLINAQLRIVDKNVYQGNYDGNDYIIHVGSGRKAGQLVYNATKKGAHYMAIVYGQDAE